MPRNKGYAPMRVRSTSTESPTVGCCNSAGEVVQPSPPPLLVRQHTCAGTGFRSPAPAPPPRYTSAPMRTSDYGGVEEPLLPQQADMPLVSRTEDMRGRLLPGYGPPRQDSDPTVMPRAKSCSTSPDGAGERPNSGGGSRRRPGPAVGGRARRLLEEEEQIPVWGSEPDCSGRPLPADIHEKRRVMMAKMRACTQASAGAFPASGSSESGAGATIATRVPQELLERRRILQSAPDRVHSDGTTTARYSSLPDRRMSSTGRPSVSSSTESDAPISLPPPQQPAVRATHPEKKLVRWHSTAAAPDWRPAPMVGKRRELPQIPAVLERQRSLQQFQLQQHQRQQHQVHCARPPGVARQISLAGTGEKAFVGSGYNRPPSIRSSELHTIHSGSFDSGDSAI